MVFHHVKSQRRIAKGIKHPVLDKVVYCAGIISLTMMAPQLWLIYHTHNASGLAPISWFTLALMDIPWIIYGYVHKEKPLVFIYTMWLISNSLVFIGSVLYG
ncbi:hypothetical protein KW807_01395 [Candidatus Parcubacteria bacterium]|nr:hypothetical protein [Candidatus Parcubacteria bacterium]